MSKRQSSKERIPSKDHPAGDDPEARKRWDRAMGITKDEESAKDSKMAKKEKVVEDRITKANGGYEDWVYQSGNLVTELIEVLEEESFGLQEFLAVAKEAARVLSKEDWTRYQEVPRRCVHATDKDVITTLFSAAEPQWRTLLTTPKKGGTCVFLHIGSEPPSTPVMDLLTKLGWFGISVSPHEPNEGNEDRIQHIALDCTKEEDEEEIIKLQVAKGSMLPKPTTFMLAFADAVWDADNMNGGVQDQVSLFKQIDGNSDANIGRKEFRNAQKAGLINADLKFKTMDINGDGTISKDEFVQAIRKNLLGAEEKLREAAQQQDKVAEVATNQSGYGLLGVTWSPEVRSRLRMLRNCISVALQRLSNQGSLVITWHGIPNHPVLLFITSQLRPVFLRVHVLVPDGTRSWETWILAASFKRSEAEEVASKGGGGFMFKNFIDNAYRCADLDDCLLWTLPVAGLLEEYRIGGGERTVAKGYNELWSAYAAKFKDLIKEFGAVTQEKVEKPKAKRKPKQPIEDKKEKAKPKPKAKPKEEEKPASKTQAEAPAEGDAVAAATVPASDGKLPAVEGATGAKGAGKGGKGPAGKFGQADTMRVMSANASPLPEKTRKLRHKHIPSRSLPNLACTFGCAPGMKLGYPSEALMSESFPIVRRAMEHLEKNSNIVERIDRDDVEFASRMMKTAKFMASAEGKSCEGLTIGMPQNQGPEAEEAPDAGVSGKGRKK